MPFLNPISAHGIDFGNIEVVVARSFDLGGRQLQPGEVVPDGALPPRRLRQMFERRMITIRAISIGPGVPPAPPPADADAPPAAGNGGVAAEIAAPATTTAKAPAEAASGPEIEALDPQPYTREAGYSVEHRGFGRWYVVGPDGATVSGPHQRAVIEHLMA
jgi:hypothetical protein